MAGDGFAHTFVNMWSRGIFSYTDGRGLFSSLTEEVKHMAIQGFLDSNLPKVRDEQLKIKAPKGFLNEIFLGQLTVGERDLLHMRQLLGLILLL